MESPTFSTTDCIYEEEISFQWFKQTTAPHKKNKWVKQGYNLSRNPKHVRKNRTDQWFTTRRIMEWRRYQDCGGINRPQVSFRAWRNTKNLKEKSSFLLSHQQDNHACLHEETPLHWFGQFRHLTRRAKEWNRDVLKAIYPKPRRNARMRIFNRSLENQGILMVAYSVDLLVLTKNEMDIERLLN